MDMGKWIMSAAVCLTSLFCANQVQAGTASYLAKCSFHDRGNNNGGSVSDMPCYAIEGGNAYGAFFHILWKDGVKTRINAKLNEPLTDSGSGRTFRRVGRYTFVADDDGDVITLDDVKYINERYSVDDPEAMKQLKLDNRTQFSNKLKENETNK